MRRTTRSDRPRRRLPAALLAAAGAGSLVATACSGSGPDAASETTQTATTGTIAENVDIGEGRSIYVECHGEGSPTVLLLSGAGTASDLWHAPDQKGPKVYDEIGTETRVCALDRPGVQYLDGAPSRSTPVPQPTTPQNGADDLTAVLDALDMEGPYVLAAHSFAGNIARVFAADHPDEVKGIVFVDVLTPELRAQMTPEEWDVWTYANARQPDQIAAYPDLEQQDFDVSLDQVEAAAPLRPMPVVVLTASVKFAELVPKYLDEGLAPPSVPRNFGEVIDRSNTAAQNELAALVPGAEHITDTDASHNIMIDNAPVTIQAIRDVLEAVRAGRTSLTLPAPDETGGDAAGLVEVNGRNLHLECTGTGSPTVILQSGFGNAGDIWSLAEAHSPAVQPGLAASNRVCSYDRPGSMITTTTAANGTVTSADAPTPGRSEPAPMPRDPGEVVTELHDLVAAANVPGPYVLVGHSLGGALNLLYARTHPDEVSALVVVDSPVPPVRGMVSPQQWEKVAVMAIPPDAIPGYELESYDVDTLFDEIEAAPPLADIPVIVITRGEISMSEDPIPDDGVGGLTAAEVEAFNEAQREAQGAFAASVPGAEQITVPGTTHYVQTQRPDAVIEAIRKVIGGT